MSAAVPGPLHPLLTSGVEYPFVKLERRRRELAPAGVPSINFGMGDPREETPQFIRDALKAALPAVSSYPATNGKPELRTACAAWLARRYGVAVDPERHVLPANGTKEAVFTLAFAILSAGAARDTVVIPTPAYPVYESGARYAGATPYFTPLRSADGWRFEPERVPEEIWRRTALLWINSPHNPTGAVLDPATAARIVALARRHGFWVASDEAYGDLWFEGSAPGTLLSHGLENVIGLYTLSKRSAMTGFRSGFMAGDPRLIDALKRFRPSVGVATPDFIQDAAIAAWNDDAHAAANRALYREKFAKVIPILAPLLDVVEPDGAFYLWPDVQRDDEAFTRDLFATQNLTILPGSYLARDTRAGNPGRNRVRISLVAPVDECITAAQRIRHYLETH